MMGLAENEKLVAAMACDEGWQWGLIDSGSAVTAAGWAIGSVRHASRQTAPTVDQCVRSAHRALR